MNTSLNRRSQEVLQRMEVRLQALEAGISRHEARAVELRQIKDRVQAEREELLATLAAPAPVPSTEPSAAGVSAPEREGGGRSERPAIKAGPPPQAAAVPDTEGATPEQLWAKLWDRRDDRKPEVIYPWSPTGEALSGQEATPSAEAVPQREKALK